MSVALVGLGSNLGDRKAILCEAIGRLHRHVDVVVSRWSRWYVTRAIGGPSGQNEFLNGAILLETQLTAHQLFDELLRVENQLGRQRDVRWNARSLDLDLLLFDDQTIDDQNLTIPHPRMVCRDFVLTPAVEVASEMIHSSSGLRIQELFNRLRQMPTYLALAGASGTGKTQLVRRLNSAYNVHGLMASTETIDLPMFDAEPTGRAWDTEIQCFQSRVGMLNESQWVDFQGTLVSDFWFDQSVAYAAICLPRNLLDHFLVQWRAARQDVIQPTLVVFLQASGSTLVERIVQRGRECEQSLTASQLEQIEHQLLEVLQQYQAGPVLRLDASDLEAVWTELVAATEAIRTRPIESLENEWEKRFRR